LEGGGVACHQEVEVAKIVEFHEVPSERNQVHEAVECGYRVIEAAGQRLVQLDTYGSVHRAVPGKVSQSIQLDEGGAEELVAILFRAFPGLRRRVG
jgi:hypothetical protein